MLTIVDMLVECLPTLTRQRNRGGNTGTTLYDLSPGTTPGVVEVRLDSLSDSEGHQREVTLQRRYFIFLTLKGT
jgi:hypothetical protein